LLGFPYNFSIVLYLIPRFLRDDFYMFIANNRYQWFGKYTACKIPSPEIQKKFLV
jgi:predicted DCC family thiol-disulfide oxidoreductase YuxK